MGPEILESPGNLLCHDTGKLSYYDECPSKFKKLKCNLWVAENIRQSIFVRVLNSSLG